MAYKHKLKIIIDKVSQNYDEISRKWMVKKKYEDIDKTAAAVCCKVFLFINFI